MEGSAGVAGREGIHGLIAVLSRNGQYASCLEDKIAGVLGCLLRRGLRSLCFGRL